MVLVFTKADPDLLVEEPVEGFGARCQAPEPAILGDLGAGVEEAPRRLASLRELRVTRGAPFLEHVRDLGGHERPRIESTDEEVMGLRVGELVRLVGVEALVLGIPLAGELPDRSCHQLGEVTANVSGMTTESANLRGKGQIITDEHRASNRQGNGETLVVGVANPDTVAVVGLIAKLAQLQIADLQEAEVTVTVLGQPVGLRDDIEFAGGERFFDLFEKFEMADRCPALGRDRSRNGGELLALDLRCTAV